MLSTLVRLLGQTLISLRRLRVTSKHFLTRLRWVLPKVAIGKAALLSLTLLVVYFVGILGIVNSRQGESYASGVPPFVEFSLEEQDQYERPSPELSAYVLFSPKEFDRQTKRLALQVGFRPPLFVGEATGTSWQLFGYDVLLQMAGARMMNQTNSSEMLFEGTRDSITVELAERYMSAGEGTAEFNWGSLRLDDRYSRPETAPLYAPFDVVLDSPTYGRGFFFRDDVFWYPFDTYGFSFNLRTRARPWIDFQNLDFTESEPSWTIVPFHFVIERGNVPGNYWTTELENWTIMSRPVGWLGVGYLDSPDEVMDGNQIGIGGLAMLVQRPTSVKILVLLFGFIYFASIVALSVVVIQIFKTRRPPTGNILVWAAALVFASVSLRAGLPTNIPYGVLFDWVFFFPSLIISILSTLFLAVNWVKRADYIP